MNIIIQLSDVLNSNYFINHNDTDPIVHCKTADELRKKLQFICSLSDEEYQKLLKRQRKKVSDIYNPLNINKLKDIFSE